MNIKEQALLAKKASYRLVTLSTNVKNKVLCDAANCLMSDSADIIRANEKDLCKAKENGMKDSLIDRLMLNEKRIADMAEGLRNIASLPDPVGEISGMTKRPNGLMIGKKRVPIGLIAIIYEARPNVTSDAFGITFKSGNAVVLRGGSDACNSCLAIAASLKKALRYNGIDEDILQYIADTSHEGIGELIGLSGTVDLVIPRGGAGLINFVVENATVPAIHTGTGNCHIFVDDEADPDMALKIIENAKTSRLGVCNACESLLIHEKIAETFLPVLAKMLSKHSIEVRADGRARKICPSFREAAEEDWGMEYLDRIISLKIVSDVTEAIDHINRYNTKHSETIVTKNLTHAELFLNLVDAACVYVNASTRFTDGNEFGFGAEIGISTQKIHARGPMGLKELTCEKYIIIGNGQIRP